MAAIAPILPLEIWAIIASHASRSDLRSLARTSRLLCHVSRERLARSIKLVQPTHSRLGAPWAQPYSETVAQLAALGLFRFVRVLTIEWDGGSDDCKVPLVDLKNLRHLRLYQTNFLCPLWTTEGAQANFVEGLNGLPNFVNFDFSGFTRVPVFASDDFALSNLETLTWKQAGVITRQFLSACKSSESTITRLSLGAKLDEQSLEECVSLFSFHFIALKTLSIGPIFSRYEDISADASTAFTAFLLRHDTLENLEVGWFPSNLNLDSLPSMALWVPTDPPSDCILPRLQTFSGSPLLLTRAIYERVNFIKTLQKLVIHCAEDDAGHEDTNGLDEMMHELQEYRDSCGDLSLRTWVLQVSLWETRYCDYLDRDSFIYWFNAAAYAFSELETFIGDIYDMEVVLETFPRFQKLRVISCAKMTVELEDVRSLAEEIPTLETFRCFKSGLTFSISRGSDGTILIRESYIDTPDDEVEDYQYLADDDPDVSSDDSSAGSWEDDSEPEYDSDYDSGSGSPVSEEPPMADSEEIGTEDEDNL